MRRVHLLLGISLALMFAASTQAGWRDFWHRSKLDYHRNVAWPEPFRTADRDLARAPFEIMKANGWQLQNTLEHVLFDPDTQELNHAGAVKVRSIAMENPIHRRTVFVLRGQNAEVTASRVESVQRVLQGIQATHGPLPQVVISDKVPHGGSGAFVELTDRARRSTVAAPILPKPEGTR